jgi:hypothetical protein
MRDRMEDMPTGGAERREPPAPMPRCTNCTADRGLRSGREVTVPCDVKRSHADEGGALEVLRYEECPACKFRYRERRIVKECVLCVLDRSIELHEERRRGE